MCELAQAIADYAESGRDRTGLRSRLRPVERQEGREAVGTRVQTFGFGAVFSDVDRSGSSAIEYYDVLGQLLARYVVPPRSDAARLSFLGVDFGSPIVGSVILTVGDRRVGDLLDVTDGGRFDLAVMDDFLYGEPQASNIALR